MNALQQPRTLHKLAITKLGVWIAIRGCNVIEELLSKEISKIKLDILANRPVYRKHENIELSEKQLWNIVIDEQIISRHIEIIRDLIRNRLNEKLNNELIIEVIQALKEVHKEWQYSRYSKRVEKRKPEQGLNAIKRMLETVLTENLTCVKLTHTRDNMEMCLDLFCLKPYLLTSLTHLELKLSLLPDRIKTESLEADIINLLKELHSLKHLSLTSYCTDNILMCIVENCKLIEELNLSLSGTRINDNSAIILIQLHNLKSVCLSGTSVCGKGIEALLFDCTHIEHIDISGLTAHILSCFFASNQKYAGKTFKLKTCQTSAPLKQLQLFIKMCPFIQNMAIRKCERDEDSNLKALVGLQYLQKLKLEDYDFYNDPVKELLQIIGRNVIHLHLKGFKQLDLDALKYISQMCPNLQSLDLNCTFLDRKSTNEELEIPPFKYLKRLSLYVLDVRSDPVPMSFLLGNCLNVEQVSISSNPHVMESIMLDILDKNPLTCLREFHVWQPRGEPKIITNLFLHRMLQYGTSYPDMI